MKTLNLTQEELVILSDLVRDGMLLRQLRSVRLTGNCPASPEEECFILQYTRAQAGYATSWTPKLLERVGVPAETLDSDNQT